MIFTISVAQYAWLQLLKITVCAFFLELLYSVSLVWALLYHLAASQWSHPRQTSVSLAVAWPGFETRGSSMAHQHFFDKKVSSKKRPAKRFQLSRILLNLIYYLTPKLVNGVAWNPWPVQIRIGVTGPSMARPMVFLKFLFSSQRPEYQNVLLSFRNVVFFLAQNVLIFASIPLDCSHVFDFTTFAISSSLLSANSSSRGKLHVYFSADDVYHNNDHKGRTLM